MDGSAVNRDRRRFQLDACIGRGGFGEVYRATVITGGGVRSVVAVKVLHPGIDARSQPIQRLRDEGRMLGAIRHPSVLKVYDLVLLQGRVCLVSEYIEGEDLEAVLRRSEPIPPRAMLTIAARVADALDAAFCAPNFVAGSRPGGQMALVHRDIKPANIRLSRHGEVKLLDFGVARGRAPREAVTEPGSLVGTSTYMAPERFIDRDEAQPSGDVYSLGLTLFEGLGGEKLYGSLSLADRSRLAFDEPRYDRFLRGRLDAIRERLPGASGSLLHRMLDLEPAARPGHRQVADACHAIVEELTGVTLDRWARDRSWPPDVEIAGSLVGTVITETPFSESAAPPPVAKTPVAVSARTPAQPVPRRAPGVLGLALVGAVTIAFGVAALGVAALGWVTLTREVPTAAMAAEPPPPVSDAGPRMSWHGDIVDGLIALTAADGTPEGRHPVPPNLRKAGQVLADSSGKPRALFTPMRMYDDRGPWTPAQSAYGLDGPHPRLPVVTLAMVDSWRQSGLDSSARMEGTLLLAEIELPIQVVVPADGPMTLAGVSGITGRVWVDETRPQNQLMAVLEGAGGALFLQGTVWAEGVTFEPLGAWLRTEEELRSALKRGCVPIPTVSFRVEPRGTVLTADQAVLRLAPKDPKTPRETSPLGYHGELWKDGAGQRVLASLAMEGVECCPMFHETDLGFDAGGLCGPSPLPGSDALYHDYLPGSIATVLWKNVGPGSGKSGVCHGNYSNFGHSLVASSAAEEVHTALARETGRPCRMQRGTWVVTDECRPLVPSVAPPPGGYAEQAGKLVRRVRAVYEPRGLVLTADTGTWVVPHEAVPPTAIGRVLRSEGLVVVLDRLGSPGWLAVPMASPEPPGKSTRLWYELVTIADHAPPPLPIADEEHLADPARPWRMVGKVELREEKLPIDLTMFPDRDQIVMEGLPSGVRATVEIDADWFHLAKGIRVWLTGPAGSVLLEGVLDGFPGATIPIVLAPVPGVLANREKLADVLVDGACYDGVIETVDGGPPARRGAGELERSHPLFSALLEDPEPWFLRDGPQQLWDWELVPADEAQFFMSGQISLTRTPFDPFTMGPFGRPQPPPEPVVRVQSTHRCGEPPDGFGTGGVKRTMSVKAEQAGTQVWVDNDPPIVTPASISVEVGTRHEFTTSVGGGRRTMSLTITADSPAEICLAPDKVCDGVESKSPIRPGGGMRLQIR